ncbi:large ribosomal subunit protein uL15-like [Convolutriloba macropyga]|uniref:large ribosomal subunit protein uL15-like n=1 Tax=Convolutriloba macropyga TaxID=536237 RepID=UPI003F51B633
MKAGNRQKKCRKMRGHVSHGHGRIGKHRKHPGGRGMAGGQHHHRILMDKFHPGYFGKVGMRNFHLKKNPRHCPTVNIDQLWSLVPEEDKKACEGNKKAPVVNVLNHGYFKVLGTGMVPSRTPMIVKARFFSKTAEQKIKKAGGACIVTA